MSDLIIRIGGDAKKFKEEVDKVKETTSALEGQLATIGKTSAVAFAALSGSIGLAVASFRESEQVAFKTEAIIKATGRTAEITASQVDELSQAISRQTTYDDEAVKSSANVLLSFKNLGEDVLPQTLRAVTDLSAGMNQDLNASADMLGKALNNPIAGMAKLTKAGILFTDAQKEQAKEMLRAGNIAGAQAIILKEVEGKFNGLAAAATQGTGAFLQLQVEAGNVVEEFGKHLAPALISVATKLKEVVIWIQEHPEIMKFAAALTVGATAVTGLTAALSAASIAFVSIRAALIAANIATGVMTVSVVGLAGATGVGLLVAAVSYLAMNWQSATDRMREYLGLAPQGRDLGKGQFGPPAPGKKGGRVTSTGEELAGKDKGAEVKAQAEELSAIELEQQRAFQEKYLAQDAEFNAMDVEQRNAFRAESETALADQIATAGAMRDAALKKRLGDKIGADKKFLEDEA